MNRYERLNEIGSGSYGVVYRALDKKTNEIVAVKKMIDRKYTSLEDCSNLTEVKALRQMNHPNIVKLNEIVHQNDMLFLVFEFMEAGSLYRLMRTRKSPFSECVIRNMCFQIFQGLAHMHANGYFHRDIKPDNFLVSKDVIKIADLRLARETNTKEPYTVVGSHWYRAPEVILRSRVHDSAVDMWAMGAIMAELFTNKPLFDGNSDGEVLYKICGVIGGLTEKIWSEGIRLAENMRYELADLPGTPLATVLPSASKEALSLIASLLSWNPSKRLTAVEALKHPFFQPNQYNQFQPSQYKQALMKKKTNTTSSAVVVEEKVVEAVVSEKVPSKSGRSRRWLHLQIPTDHIFSGNSKKKPPEKPIHGSHSSGRKIHTRNPPENSDL